MFIPVLFFHFLIHFDMLQFKDIKPNSNIYILDKNVIEVLTGKVTTVSFPKMEYNPQTGQQQMMITLGIEANGKSSTYVMSESSSAVTTGDLVIATEKVGLLHDIEILNNTSEQFLADVNNLIERNKMVKERATSLLSELNPIYKERRETEKRFTNIEEKFSNIEKKFDGMNRMLEDFIKKMES